MTNDKACIYTCDKLFKAELIKQYLADHDIAAFLLNKKDSAYGFGEIEIYVNRDNAMTAIRLIEKLNENE